MRSADVAGLDIDSHDLFFVNGVDVVPLVDDEWSLAQTLRHLVLATDAWLRGGIMRIEQPFHEIGQIFSSAAEMGFDLSMFRTDTPTFEEILAVRAERQELVTDLLATVTPALLAGQPLGRRGAPDLTQDARGPVLVTRSCRIG